MPQKWDKSTSEDWWIVVPTDKVKSFEFYVWGVTQLEPSGFYAQNFYYVSSEKITMNVVCGGETVLSASTFYLISGAGLNNNGVLFTESLDS